ncbi:MAG: hypothetical protein ABSH13_21575 [Candidatus Acidiferrum sp.]|jgi:hypothetical protein
MTIQTKHFIEVSDIIGMRCQCKNEQCRATLLLPLNGDVNDALLKCPKCGRGWARLEGGTSFEVEIKKYLSELGKLKESMKHFGFALTLEISETPARSLPLS